MPAAKKLIPQPLGKADGPLARWIYVYIGIYWFNRTRVLRYPPSLMLSSSLAVVNTIYKCHARLAMMYLPSK